MTINGPLKKQTFIYKRNLTLAKGKVSYNNHNAKLSYNKLLINKRLRIYILSICIVNINKTGSKMLYNKKNHCIPLHVFNKGKFL